MSLSTKSNLMSYTTLEEMEENNFLIKHYKLKFIKERLLSEKNLGNRCFDRNYFPRHYIMYHFSINDKRFNHFILTFNTGWFGVIKNVEVEVYDENKILIFEEVFTSEEEVNYLYNLCKRSVEYYNRKYVYFA